MGQARGTPRPVRIRLLDPELQTTRIRGIGFRVVYRDGSYGPRRKTYAEARADARQRPA